MQFEPRIHFEWVWDGRRLWIVQADAEESTAGADPTGILRTLIQASNVGVLRDFHLATNVDFQSYDKLGKADLYHKLGYEMPPFFVADDPGVMARVLEGDISCDLENDLNELIGRPLIIRTDGIGIPSDKREMLPRSDPLTTTAEARDWLLGNFRAEIKNALLDNTRLCLIAHHFIPSVASAWARAEPEAPLVRIEALWGIPEGLYWYSHDTFEVDTLHAKLPAIRSIDNSQFRLALRRLRYKGTFVAADENGKWAPSKVSAPFDWRFSITKQKWLFEIALITRRIAECEGYPVAVMWLINNHPGATRHGVLPWYHSKSNLVDPRRAAPRRKLANSDDLVVRNQSDWKMLRRRLESGLRVERVVVQPMDAGLIRNPTFARELGKLGAAKSFVIELAGGILSHAYYILTKVGAQVECIDLSGADEDFVEYNKIVRDKIPDIISGRGERAESVYLEGEALTAALRQKLVEESFEAMDANSDHHLIGELADVSEVIGALCSALKLSPSDLRTIQEEKCEDRGGFDKGVMLRQTVTPHSIHVSSPEVPKPLLMLEAQVSEAHVIGRPTDLPSKSLYRRPDLRQVDMQPEKLFTFATEVNKLGDVSATLHFSLPIHKGDERGFTLTLELQRSGGVLRGKIRVRLVPSQCTFDFVDNESSTS